jgi:hypothetical protein
VADNPLELVLRAITAKFDQSIDQSTAKVEQFSTEGQKHLTKFGDVVGKLENASKGLHGVFSDLVEAWAGSKILQFLKSFVDEASNIEARVGQLNNAIDDAAASAQKAGKAFSGTGEEMQKFAEKLAAGAGQPLDKVIQGMTNFVTIGLDANQTMALSGVAADISARRHMDYGRVQQLLGRAITSGTVLPLIRLGLTYKDIDLKTATVTESVQKLADKYRGAASKAAGDYEHALARLDVIGKQVQETFGAKLLGALGAVADKMVYVFEVINALSPEAKQLISVVVGIAGAFLGVAMILPLITQLIVITRNAVAALAAAFEFLAFNPIGLVIVAVVALGVVLYELINHLDDLGRAWGNATNFMSKAWAEFVRNVLSSKGELLKFFKALLEMMSLSTLGQGVMDMADIDARDMKNTTTSIFNGIRKGVDLGLDYFKKLFKMAKIEMPKMPKMPGIGDLDAFGKPKPEKSGKDESNRIAAFKDVLAERMAVYKDAIERQKGYIEQLDAQKDLIESKIGAQGPTASQSAALDTIDTKKIQRQEALRKLYRQTADEERNALQVLEKERNRIAGNKALESQWRELNALIREHKKLVGEDLLEAIKADVAKAKIAQEENKRHLEEKKKLEEHLAQIREIMAAERDYALTKTRSDRELEAGGRRNSTALDTASDNVARTSEDVAEANARVADATQALAEAKGREDELKAERALIEAKKAALDAETKLAIAIMAETRLIEEVQNPFRKLGQTFLDGIPELNNLINAFQEARTLGINPWMAVLSILIQNSKTFADLQKIVANFMKLIGQILDQILRPVLLIVAKVLTLVANGLIVLYNGFATLVGILGIHIQKLKYINSLLDDTGSGIKPLLDIVHDLPSLKEYGAGSWGPLQPDQYSGTSGIVAAISSQTTTQTSFFTRLVSLGAALLALDWLTHGKFFSDMGGFINNFIQGIGGLSNFIEMAGGIALITANTKGIFGIITKVLGVLLIIQSLFGILGGGGGILGSILGGGIVKGSTSLLGGGGAGGLGSLGGGSSVGSSISAVLGTHIGDATVGTAGLAAIGGALVGSFLANFTGAANKAGGKQDASALAGAGAAVGLIFGGPVGAAIGTIAGTLIGGLFGNPNKGDAPLYGQTAADLSGSNNANNAGYTEDPQLKAALGGDTLIQAVEKTLAKYGTASNAPTWLQPIFSQLSNMFGVSSTGSGSIQYGKNEMLGVNAPGAQGGTPFTYQQYDAIITQFLTGLSGAATSAGTGGTGSTAVSTNVGTAPTESDLINSVLASIGIDPTAAGDPTLGVPSMSGGTGSTARSLLDSTSSTPSDPLTLAITNLTTVMANLYNYFTGVVSGVASGISGGAPSANVVPSAPPLGGNMRSPLAGSSVQNVTQNNTFGDVNGVDNLDALNASLGRQIGILSRTDAFSSFR